MPFSQHGDYEIRQTEDRVYLTWRNSWNMETLRAFHKDIREAYEARHGRAFIEIADVREWGLSSQEFFADLADAGWDQAKLYAGMILQVVVVNPGLEHDIVRDMYQSRVSFPVIVVDDITLVESAIEDFFDGPEAV